MMSASEALEGVGAIAGGRPSVSGAALGALSAGAGVGTGAASAAAAAAGVTATAAGVAATAVAGGGDVTVAAPENICTHAAVSQIAHAHMSTHAHRF